MFKKTNRLSKSEFSSYFNQGKKHHFPHLTIITKPNQQTKVAVVVGKKVSKSAVRRNLLKRRTVSKLKRLETKPNTFGVLILILKPTYNSLNRKTAEEILDQSIAQVFKTT